MQLGSLYGDVEIRAKGKRFICLRGLRNLLHTFALRHGGDRTASAGVEPAGDVVELQRICGLDREHAEEAGDCQHQPECACCESTPHHVLSPMRLRILLKVNPLAANLSFMNLIVSTQWVADRLGDKKLVLVDATMPPVGVTPAVDTRGRYVAEHLPGAVFFSIDDLSDHSSGLPHTLPSAESFGESMEALGIGKDDTIVVYEQVGVFSAPRAVWMLRSFGAKDVHLLDGGLAAWKAAGFSTESGEVTRERASFAAELKPGAMTTFAELQGKIARGEQILDARAKGRFDGTAPEPRAGLSSGHMPGAVNAPFMELAMDGKMKSPEELREYFAAKGIDLSQPCTTSCGSGVTAAVVSLALELAGAEKLSLYDGSWAEYASRPEAVIVKD